MKKQADVLVQGGSSQYVFTALTKKAKRWVKQHVQIESWQWIDTGFAVDHRYAGALARGMVGDGLVVK